MFISRTVTADDAFVTDQVIPLFRTTEFIQLKNQISLEDENAVKHFYEKTGTLVFFIIIKYTRLQIEVCLVN